MKYAIALGAAAIGVAFHAPVFAAAPDASDLAAKYNCKACHSPASKLVGPSYQDVAKKYAGDASAPAKLAAKIKSGGAGVWGQIPMPPNNVPDADLQKLVAWILSN